MADTMAVHAEILARICPRLPLEARTPLSAYSFQSSPGMACSPTVQICESSIDSADVRCTLRTDSENYQHSS